MRGLGALLAVWIASAISGAGATIIDGGGPVVRIGKEFAATEPTVWGSEAHPSSGECVLVE